AEGVGRLEIDEVRDRHQRGVEAIPRKNDRERWLCVDHRVPGLDVPEAGQDHFPVPAHQLSEFWVELLASALAGEAPGRLDSSGAICDLDELRDLCEPRRERDLLPFQLARPPAPIP